METLKPSGVSLSDLQRLVDIQEGRSAEHAWTQVDAIPLSDREQTQLQDITARILGYDTLLMNEATIWSRAIYPLLVLAEQGQIQAWAGIPLEADYPHFRMEGIADGVLAENVAGRAESPHLVVVETKRGVDGQNPVFQLYAQLLAAAYLNWKRDRKPCQEVFGCYTIADGWKFLRAEVAGFEADKPTMRLEYSREYGEKFEAATILRILKAIVARFLDND